MIEEIKITSLSGRGSVFMKSREYWNYWLGPVDWGQVQGNHQTYKYTNQVGSSIVSTSLQERPLSITGWVVNAEGDTLQQRCDFLNAFISPVEDYVLEYKGKKIQFRPDISIAYSPEYIKNNEKVRRFLIQATCPFPLFSDAEDTAVPFDQAEKMFRFPTDFGRGKPIIFAVTGKAYNVVINNKGGFPSGIIAKIRFSGEVENPRIYRLDDGKYIGLSKTFYNGEQLEISTLPGSKHVYLFKANGQKEDLIKYRDYKTTWIQLQPGDNRLAIECEDIDQRGNMDVTIYYTPLYLEVE